MNNTNKDLSYFKLRLLELLQSSFPEKAQDEKFIQQRSSWAANAYEGSFYAGDTVAQCNEIAYSILFDGLHYSRFDTIFLILCREFSNVIADQDIRAFALKILPHCSAIFSNYPLDEDFAYSADYELLYTELTGTVALYIEEHGL